MKCLNILKIMQLQLREFIVLYECFIFLYELFFIMFYETIIIHIVYVFYFTDLLIWCRAAETLTDHLTDLGQNVTINCDLDVKEVIWLLLKLLDPPVMILLSSTTSANFYFNKTFKQKYSVQSKHRLFINNVTLDDLGLYYCLTTDFPPKYSDCTRLHITEPTPDLEIQNHTVAKYTEKNQTHLQIISLISGLLSGLLIIVIIGELFEMCFSVFKNGKA
uniref:Immunoglobulin domain-containing protein n=1 Tax=Cyprinus carpio carpio TaxID=630221 RepID=A0A9J7Y9Z1_CYPCA